MGLPFVAFLVLFKFSFVNIAGCLSSSLHLISKHAFSLAAYYHFFTNHLLFELLLIPRGWPPCAFTSPYAGSLVTQDMIFHVLKAAGHTSLRDHGCPCFCSDSPLSLPMNE